MSISALGLVVVVSFLGSHGLAGPKLREVLYTSDGNLCSVSAAGAGASCLKGSEEFDSPSWQPRGQWIVAEAGKHDGARALVLLDSAGHIARTLASSVGAVRPVWTPDGAFIYAVDYDIGSAVARWTADGRTRVRLPVVGGADSGQVLRPGAPPARFQMISFSPSGRRAALLTMDFRKMVIASVGQRELTVTSTAPQDFDYVSQAVWLDEARLLFVGKQGTRQGELWELRVSDGTLRKRGIGGLWLRDQLVLSPDGGSVAITAVADTTPSASPSPKTPTQWNVWVYSLATMTKRRLTGGREDIVAAWR